MRFPFRRKPHTMTITFTQNVDLDALAAGAPGIWAFKVRPENAAAHDWMHRVYPQREQVWIEMTEQEYVSALYRLRKDALTAGDQRYIARLNSAYPPPESQTA